MVKLSLPRLALLSLLYASCYAAHEVRAAEAASGPKPRDTLVRIDAHDGTPAFCMGVTEVTVEAFAGFVEQTGYRTTAEREPGHAAVFDGRLPSRPVAGTAWWWRLDEAASWRAPDGAGSRAGPDEPVVQVTLADARAYAHWVNGELPTGKQWAAATRGRPRARGAPPRAAANVWRGEFPFHEDGSDGHVGRAPVASYEPDARGLHDLVGNVWEWTIDGDTGRSAGVRGGSFLCSENFCRKFSADGVERADPALGTSHIGFRIVRPLGPIGDCGAPEASTAYGAAHGFQTDRSVSLPASCPSG